MALLWPDSPVRHVLDRAMQRCRMTLEQAERIVASVRQVIEQQAPVDWRFTTSPHGVFVIGYEPEGVGCSFLGRSFREREGTGEQLVQRLQAERVSVEELQACLEAYRRLILSPDCAVYHELRTCYQGPMDVSEEKQSLPKTKEALGHVVLLSERRVALRPNALVIKYQLWVRQGEFFDLAQGDQADYQEFLLFQPLRSTGVDKSRCRIYSLNRQGYIRFVREVNGGVFQPVRVPRGPGQRSQSYWLLPTRVDARYNDLDYARSAWSGDNDRQLTAADMLLLARLEKLRSMLGRNSKRDV